MLKRHACALVALLSIAAASQPMARHVLPAVLLPPSSDPKLLHLLAALAPGAPVLSAMVLDIDRDGDLDVLAVTRQSVEVWVNQGSGRFTHARVPPRRAGFASPGVLTDARRSATPALARRFDEKRVLASVQSLNHSLTSSVRVVGASAGLPGAQHLDPSLGRAPPSHVLV